MNLFLYVLILSIFLWMIIVKDFNMILVLGCCFDFRLTYVCQGFLFLVVNCIMESFFALRLVSIIQDLVFLMVIMEYSHGMGFSAFIIMLLSGFNTLKILFLIFYFYQTMCPNDICWSWVSKLSLW